MDSKDKTLFNNDVLIVVKDISDDNYYYTDAKGKKIPINDAVKEHSIINSRGKTIPPSIIKVDIVDNSYLERFLYE